MKNSLENFMRRMPYLKRLFSQIEELETERERYIAEIDKYGSEVNEYKSELDRYRLETERLSEAVKQSQSEKTQLLSDLEKYKTWVPPGHFYSPIPAQDDVRRHEKEIYRVPRTMPSLNLNEEGQIELFDQLLAYYTEQPFTAQKKEGLRYWFENPAYSYSDAIFLYCMMRHTQPRRIIEVGSGYSSCAMLDVNELFFNNSIACTFIDPHPELLRSLIKESDEQRIRIIEQEVQQVELDLFWELEKGDILFVDSSHVSKVNSDVNHIFFKILPGLKSGVYLHFHDIFYPFEYPLDWVYEGRAWNEAYLLRAFLQYNDQFEIQIFNTFIDWFHKEKYFREMPLVQKNTGGSIWLKKL